jgi:hypothetical protein
VAAVGKRAKTGTEAEEFEEAAGDSSKRAKTGTEAEEEDEAAGNEKKRAKTGNKKAKDEVGTLHTLLSLTALPL